MSDKDAETLGRAIRAAREARGWTQAELAARIDRKQVAVSYYENGQRTIDVPTLRAMEEALGVRFGAQGPDAPTQARLWMARGKFEAIAGMADAIAAEARKASAALGADATPLDVAARGTEALAALDARPAARASAATARPARRVGHR